MNKDVTSVLAINKYLTSCKNDSKKSDMLRKYLKHKVGKLIQKQREKPKISVFFWFPVNLFLF